MKKYEDFSQQAKTAIVSLKKDYPNERTRIRSLLPHQRFELSIVNWLYFKGCPDTEVNDAWEHITYQYRIHDNLPPDYFLPQREE